MFAIDEAPAAYKPIEDIIGPIAESVDIIDSFAAQIGIGEK